MRSVPGCTPMISTAYGGVACGSRSATHWFAIENTSTGPVTSSDWLPLYATIATLRVVARRANGATVDFLLPCVCMARNVPASGCGGNDIEAAISARTGGD